MRASSTRPTGSVKLGAVPPRRRGTGRAHRSLVRTDAAGATHDFMDCLHERRRSYSIGFTLGDITGVLANIAATVWTTRLRR
jgi:hypothetical protein